MDSVAYKFKDYDSINQIQHFFPEIYFNLAYFQEKELFQI